MLCAFNGRFPPACRVELLLMNAHTASPLSNSAASHCARWVPADPLTGFVDRPRDVEANLPKERQPVAYAVALAGGGAKDVTSR